VLSIAMQWHGCTLRHATPCVGADLFDRSLLVLLDGARWIRAFDHAYQPPLMRWSTARPTGLASGQSLCQVR